MDITEIKEKVRLAEEAVQDVEDNTLKNTAFGLVLQHLLGAQIATRNPERQAQEQPPEQIQEPGNEEPERQVTAGGIQALQIATTLTRDQIDNVLDIDDKEIKILGEIPGINQAEKHVNGALILLTAQCHVLGERECQSSTIIAELQDSGVKSLQHFSESVKDAENYFVKKGRVCRITEPGRRKGVELIKAMAAKYN